MSLISLRPYDSSFEALWNDCNKRAVNGHFLFDRSFMDYHADLFTDCSAVLFRDELAAAVFPANLAGDNLHSHQGLTFGGLVYSDNLRMAEILDMFRLLGEHGRTVGARAIVYKAIPPIYHRSPADAPLYALFRNNAVCCSRALTSTIDYRCPGLRSRRRSRGVRKSRTSGLELAWEESWDEYWLILAEVLRRRHNKRPVHTANELCLLAKRFPASIRLVAARKDGAMVAGVVMFESACVAHAQYIAASPYGQALSALDTIFDYLIGYYSETKRYFDFGVSTENGGTYLNEGLADYKQEWGGGYIVHDTYEWTL